MPLQDVIWPAECFYWALLEAPGVRAGVLPAGLLTLLQDEVPVPAEGLHTVCVPCGEGNVLVCAAEHGALAPFRVSALSVSPRSIPALRNGEEFTGIDPAALNLLTGAFEPVPLCRERSRRGMILTASVVLLAGVMSIGFARHAKAWDTATEDALTLTSQFLTDAGHAGSVQALKQEVDRLRATPRSDGTASPQDASVALAALLAGWPKGVECQTEAVAVTASTISISLSVNGDARPLLAAIKTPEGWSLDEPRLSANAQVARVHLTFRRAGGKA